MHCRCRQKNLLLGWDKVIILNTRQSITSLQCVIVVPTDRWSHQFSLTGHDCYHGYHSSNKTTIRNKEQGSYFSLTFDLHCKVIAALFIIPYYRDYYLVYLAIYSTNPERWKLLVQIWSRSIDENLKLSRVVNGTRMTNGTYSISFSLRLVIFTCHCLDMIKVTAEICHLWKLEVVMDGKWYKDDKWYM